MHAHPVFHGGEATGGPSCNRLGGGAVGHERTVLVTDPGGTKRLCREQDIGWEIAIFDVLDGDVAHTLDVDRFELTDADDGLHPRAAF